MPLHWTVDSQNQTFEVVADGVVDLGEVNAMIDALVGANALGYRKLFDGTLGDTRMGAMDILSVGVRLRGLHAGNTLGPLAVVVPKEKYELLSRVLGILAAARRPMAVFTETGKARKWLESPAIRGTLQVAELGPTASR